MDNEKESQPARRRFKAIIDGKSYTIVGNQTEAHMQAVSDLMNKQLAQLKKLAPDMSGEEASILLAFNAISDQLEKAEASDQVKKRSDDATSSSGSLL
ncbi:cell division protein ZapA [Secundilactobacillus sp. HBUAS58055]|uniref:cell division protein ZapA n=1 Tax=Secundilactobacillus angelensis TaxID=2722706 RepID=UPI001E42C23D|nr:cell division protein ZapA [Secundilactobacillus angelensis]MCH5462585.1 cell division protein ZapA [Secundilactobacillus angelensis]